MKKKTHTTDYHGDDFRIQTLIKPLNSYYLNNLMFIPTITQKPRKLHILEVSLFTSKKKFLQVFKMKKILQRFQDMGP